MTIIQKMQRSNVPHVEKLLRGTWPDSERVARTVLRELEDMFSNAEYRPTFFVAEDHDRIVGCGAWNWSWLNYGMYEICWGCVLENYRGRGIGRALVEARLEDIQLTSSAEGEKTFTVLTSTHLPLLYEKYGFRSIEITPSEVTLENVSHLMVWCK